MHAAESHSIKGNMQNIRRCPSRAHKIIRRERMKHMKCVAYPRRAGRVDEALWKFEVMLSQWRHHFHRRRVGQEGGKGNVGWSEASGARRSRRIKVCWKVCTWKGVLCIRRPFDPGTQASRQRRGGKRLLCGGNPYRPRETFAKTSCGAAS